MFLKIKKSVSKSILLISILCFHNQLSLADDFLNTDDFETYSLVQGTGQERGFYVQVTLFFNENTLPKQSLLPFSEPVDEALINQKLIELEPNLIFENNTAECDIYQVYYSTDDFVAGGTNVTYAYLINVKSNASNKGCSLSISNSEDLKIIRSIEYTTANGEN